MKNQYVSYYFSINDKEAQNIHSNEGVLALTQESCLHKLLEALEGDGHDVSGAFFELSTLLNYVVHHERNKSDIVTHLKYVLSKIEE